MKKIGTLFVTAILTVMKHPLGVLSEMARMQKPMDTEIRRAL